MALNTQHCRLALQRCYDWPAEVVEAGNSERFAAAAIEPKTLFLVCVLHLPYKSADAFQVISCWHLRQMVMVTQVSWFKPCSFDVSLVASTLNRLSWEPTGSLSRIDGLYKWDCPGFINRQMAPVLFYDTYFTLVSKASSKSHYSLLVIRTYDFEFIWCFVNGDELELAGMIAILKVF